MKEIIKEGKSKKIKLLNKKIKFVKKIVEKEKKQDWKLKIKIII